MTKRLVRVRWLGRLPYAESWDLQKAFWEGRVGGRSHDDYLLLLEHRDDAQRMLAALSERLAKFNLQLPEGKTRLVEFGRFAEANRRRRGEGRPETFDFLGFTYYVGKTRKGRFMVQ